MGKGEVDLTSPEQANQRRDQIEDELIIDVESVVEQFLRDVKEQADEAFYAPALTAAGRRVANPFAYTNVINRWRELVRDFVAHRDDLGEVQGLFERSDLPDAVFADVTEVLTEQGLTEMGRRRKLTRLLVPRKDEDKGRYKNKIVTIARSAATRRFNQTQLNDLAEAGYTEKTWVSRHDNATRETHLEADGTTLPLAEAFVVGDSTLMYPGDLTGSTGETVNCRCVIVGYGQRTTAAGPQEEAGIVAAVEGETTMKKIGWHGIIGVEGSVTGDGRLIDKGALRWEDLPIKMRYVSSDVGAHDGAVVVGNITEITRADSGMIEARGWFDAGSEFGLEAARQVREELTNGVSMDLDDVSFEIRVAGEVVERMTQAPEISEDGEIEIEFPDPDEDGRVTVAEIKADDEVMVTTSARIRAATQVAIPAFVEARIYLDDPEAFDAFMEGGSMIEEEEGELVAAGGPLAPPSAWFNDPQFDQLTPITVTESGHIYGHLAAWETCHIGFAGECVAPPSSNTGYAYFHVGSLMTAEGKEVAVGRITLDTGHAGPKLDAVRTLAHYDNTGTAVADVRVGEDRFGIWVSGAVRPGLSDKRLRSLRSSPLSGDWRRVNGNLELVAALAVNVPGFPIPRPAGLVAGGQMQSLVASGLVPPKKVAKPGTEGALSLDDLKWLKKIAAKARSENASMKAKVLMQRVRNLSQIKNTLI